MIERRYVVEIARPVPGEDVEAAANYIAQRLAIDVGRIRTLLGGRTGAVTRELAADKADAIAGVFGEAGVMVTVVERPAEQEQAASVADPTPVSGAGVDFEYDGPERQGEVDVPWDDADAEAADGGSEPPAAANGSYRHDEGVASEAPDVVQAPAAPADPPEMDSERPTLDLRPSSTRWVPSPHADIGDEADYYDDSDDERLDELGDLFAGVSTQGATRQADETHDVVFSDLNAKRQEERERQPDREDEAAGASLGADDSLEHRLDDGFDYDDDSRGELWRAPERSPFGDYDAAPADRPVLRRYLVWGLIVSVLLLVALQLVFAFNGRSTTGVASYDDGLAPYRSGDFVAARGIWEDAARRGDARAQYMVGYLAQNGLGQPWSNREAVEWYDRAADQGLPEAQTALAQMYLEGLGVDPQPERGLELLRNAAAAGYSTALYRYGELLFHGRWVTQDYAAALEAFEAAAAGGSLEAADFVGLAQYLSERVAQ